MKYLISTKNLKDTNYEYIVSNLHFSIYSKASQIPEKGTYYYNVYELIENIYKHGLSFYHYSLLQEGKENFFIEKTELAQFVESIKNTIKKELARRDDENRPYLKHTIRKIFEGEEIKLNNKDDSDDIRIVGLISFLNMLQDAYEKNEKVYFCVYTPPPSDW
ncbi:hypothetical protein QNI19_05865 [Cytophagaceae bacterium DM2B3-1]|uniref:Uncharacterized protein n=1 Tax=Xanthocytophaga flava TaxID=3048013 RepID=A0ABT7CFN5_9BACT|nr:hypothetical protein [Xanthocytophaga flavus]MDJ1470986.1 hypothetical protein [Xanthocytophaga flavus]MDJ1492447.1 hypothetical protein [Xanthocytophaga flavus]